MEIMTRKIEIDELTRTLDYTFKNPELLFQAFRHASYVNEHANSDLKDNERLEFLGDAVLDLAISHFLMDIFQNAEEGSLSKFRSVVVDETGLYQVAVSLRLGNYLLLGKGEEQSHGREKPSILSNTVEALLGALYLDAGFNKTMKIIGRLFSPLLEGVKAKEIAHDFKSALQEYTQKTYKTLPDYRLARESGPAHDKIFSVELTIADKVIAIGNGKSKKEAEQNAAKEAFFCLKQD